MTMRYCVYCKTFGSKKQETLTIVPFGYNTTEKIHIQNDTNYNTDRIYRFVNKWACMKCGSVYDMVDI